MSKEDLFDRMFKRADEMFAKADKMFADFPWSEPLDNRGFFTSTVEYTTPKEEPANDPVEYKVVEVHTLSNSQGADLETELNKLGAEGWELKFYDGGKAVFMRFVEDDNA